MSPRPQLQQLQQLQLQDGGHCVQADSRRCKNVSFLRHRICSNINTTIRCRALAEQSKAKRQKLKTKRQKLALNRFATLRWTHDTAIQRSRCSDSRWVIPTWPKVNYKLQPGDCTSTVQAGGERRGVRAAQVKSALRPTFSTAGKMTLCKLIWSFEGRLPLLVSQVHARKERSVLHVFRVWLSL